MEKFRYKFSSYKSIKIYALKIQLNFFTIPYNTHMHAFVCRMCV